MRHGKKSTSTYHVGVKFYIVLIHCLSSVSSFQGGAQLCRTAFCTNIPSMYNAQCGICRRKPHHSFCIKWLQLSSRSRDQGGDKEYGTSPPKLEIHIEEVIVDDVQIYAIESTPTGRAIAIMVFSLPTTIAISFFIYSLHQVLVLANHVASHGMYAVGLH
jgi:hypothetical protein